MNTESPLRRRLMEEPDHWMDRYTHAELAQMSRITGAPPDDEALIAALVDTCIDRAWEQESWFIGGRAALQAVVVARVRTWPTTTVRACMDNDDGYRAHCFRRDFKYQEDLDDSLALLRELVAEWRGDAWDRDGWRFSEEEMAAEFERRIRAYYAELGSE